MVSLVPAVCLRAVLTSSCSLSCATSALSSMVSSILRFNGNRPAPRSDRMPGGPQFTTVPDLSIQSRKKIHLWQADAQSRIRSRGHTQGRWLISRVGPQIVEQILRGERRLDPRLRFGAGIGDRLGTVDHQLRNAVFDGAPGEGTDVVTVEFALREHLGSILGSGGNGVAA